MQLCMDSKINLETINFMLILIFTVLDDDSTLKNAANPTINTLTKYKLM